MQGASSPIINSHRQMKSNRQRAQLILFPPPPPPPPPHPLWSESGLADPEMHQWEPVKTTDPCRTRCGIAHQSTAKKTRGRHPGTGDSSSESGVGSKRGILAANRHARRQPASLGRDAPSDTATASCQRRKTTTQRNKETMEQGYPWECCGSPVLLVWTLYNQTPPTRRPKEGHDPWAANAWSPTHGAPK